MRPTVARHDASPPDAGIGGGAGRHGFPWAPADSPPGPQAPAPQAPAGPAPWAPPVVATDVPALDAIIDGSVDVPGTFRDKDRATRKKLARRGRRPQAAHPSPRTSPADRPSSDASPDADATPSLSTRSSRRERRAPQRPAGAGLRTLSSPAAGLRAAGATAIRLARRRVPGRFAHRATLLGAGGLALVAGIGVGAALDAVGPAGVEASVSAESSVATSPEVCAAAQVAWSRAAAAQVQMDAESPGTLRQGFVVARDALAAATPPNAVATEWKTVSTYVATVADAAESAGKGEVEAVVASTLAGLDTPGMTTASQQVTAHLAEDCQS